MSCDVCNDTHVVPAGWVFQRAISCTCGAGDGEMKLHAPDCDPVPCPFCQLIDERVYWIVQENDL